MKRHLQLYLVSLCLLLGVATGSNATPTGSTSAAVSGERDDRHDHGRAIGEIYQLQAAFHLAKTKADIDLMMSLWADDAVFIFQGDPKSPYVGTDAIRAFFLQSGSFTHRRFSLVPSYKIRIDVHDKEAFLYFECHDVGDYDLPTRFIAGDTFLGGTLRKVDDQWVFSEMTAGQAFPLDADHDYYP